MPLWFDRVLAVVLGLVFCPVRTVRAFRAGVGRRNLFGMPTAELLASDVVELERRIRGGCAHRR